MNDQSYSATREYLQRLNAMCRFHDTMRDAGVQNVEEMFPWLAWEDSERLLQELVVKHRLNKKGVRNTFQQACVEYCSWLKNQTEKLLCFVPNVGAMMAKPENFLLHFDYFSGFAHDYLHFSTLSLNSAYRIEEFEGNYHCSGW